MAEQDGGLIGAEEKVINSKNKMDENMVSCLSFAHTFPLVHWSRCMVVRTSRLMCVPVLHRVERRGPVKLLFS